MAAAAESLAVISCASADANCLSSCTTCTQRERTRSRSLVHRGKHAIHASMHTYPLLRSPGMTELALQSRQRPQQQRHTDVSILRLGRRRVLATLSCGLVTVWRRLWLACSGAVSPHATVHGGLDLIQCRLQLRRAFLGSLCFRSLAVPDAAAACEHTQLLPTDNGRVTLTFVAASCWLAAD